MSPCNLIDEVRSIDRISVSNVEDVLSPATSKSGSPNMLTEDVRSIDNISVGVVGGVPSPLTSKSGSPNNLTDEVRSIERISVSQVPVRSPITSKSGSPNNLTDDVRLMDTISVSQEPTSFLPSIGRIRRTTLVLVLLLPSMVVTTFTFTAFSSFIASVGSSSLNFRTVTCPRKSTDRTASSHTPSQSSSTPTVESSVNTSKNESTDQLFD